MTSRCTVSCRPLREGGLEGRELCHRSWRGCVRVHGKTRTKDGGTSLTYIIAANWAAITLGLVGGMELAMSTELGFASDEIALRVTLRCDCTLTTPQSVVICDQLAIPS